MTPGAVSAPANAANWAAFLLPVRVALNSPFSFTGIKFGVLTIVIGHATFGIVVVFNNVIARFRRVPGSLAEASMDLGARPADAAVYHAPEGGGRADLRGAAGVRTRPVRNVPVARTGTGTAGDGWAGDRRQRPRPAGGPG